MSTVFDNSFSIKQIGVTTVTATSASLATVSGKAVIFKADPANAGTCYVNFKDTAAATTSYPLAAGDVMPIQPCANLNEFTVIGTASDLLFHVLYSD